VASDNITLRCRCGSTQFRLPNASAPKPADVVTCARCGAKAQYGDLQKQAAELVKQELQKKLQSALGGSKGLKLKF
jgi:hypothetical protein